MPLAEIWMNLEDVIQSEVSQKEKQKQIYTNAYMWDLEKQQRSFYLQIRNRGTNVEKKHMDTKG